MQKLIDSIDALSLRERLLLLAAILFVLFSAWNLFLMHPIYASQKDTQKQATALRQQIESLNKAIQTTVTASKQDPNAQLNAEIDQTRHQLDGLDARLREATGGLVDPKDMAHLLEEVLSKQHGLKLVAVHSLPPEPVLKLDQKKDSANVDIPGVSFVYRHGLRMELEGSYSATLAYLQALENSKWRFFWDSLELHTEKYPNNRVTIEVHTLSLKEGWLGV